jgi:hypothetical protein
MALTDSDHGGSTGPAFRAITTRRARRFSRAVENKAIQRLQDQGKTVVFLSGTASRSRISRQAVADLKALGVRPVMLTR